MKKHPALLLLATFAFTAYAADQSVEVFWDFGTTSPFSDTPSITPHDTLFAVSAISKVNGGNGAMLSSASATGSPSGGGNASLQAKGGSLDLTASPYFTWTMTPKESSLPATFLLTDFSFYSRSTEQGPAAWQLVAIVDSVASVIAQGSCSPASSPSWISHANPLLEKTFASNNTIIFHLYGYNGTATSTPGTANWRIDDLKLTLSCDDDVQTFFPPVLTATYTNNTSIVLAWQDVDTATSYALDVSTSPTFTQPGTPITTCSGTSTNLTALNGWIINNVITTASGDKGLRLVKDSLITSPTLVLTACSAAQFTFDARSYGSLQVARLIKVEASSDGTTWEAVGNFTPNNAILADNPAVMDLTPWCGRSISLRLSTPGATGDTAGSAVANLRVESLVPDFLVPYNNYSVSGTTLTLSGLTPATTYYFRARSVNASETSVNSAVFAVKTYSVDLPVVTLLGAQNIKHDSATLAWQGIAPATGYQVEVYKTNATSNVSGPRVIITQSLKGSSDNKVVELTNIGNQPADLSGYTLKRDSGAGFANDFALNSGSLNNGASLTLAPGQSLLVVRNGADNTWLAQMPTLRTTSNCMNFTGGNTIGLFLNSEHCDSVPVKDTTTYIRSSIISVGQPVVDLSDWLILAVPADLSTSDLGQHICAIPVHTQTNIADTSHRVSNLRPYVTYAWRVRAIGQTSASPWSVLGDFTTIAPPRGTIYMIR